MAKLEKNIEIVIKRITIEEYGVQDILEPEKYVDYLKSTWFSVFEEYPQMVLPLIDKRTYREYVQDPVEYIEKYKSDILNQIDFKIRRYNIGGERLTPKAVSKAFVKLLFEVFNDRSVKTLTF